MFYWFFQWIFKVTAFIPQLFLINPKVYYEDKAVQSRKIKGKAIVASNHHTVLDVAVMTYVFWGRTLRCLMAEILYKKNFFMTLFVKCFGGIKVDRDAHDFSFISRSKKVLDKGGVIEIYPESRLARPNEQKPLPFKPSVIYLALESDAPIIPVYHNGNHFKKGKCKVVIGKPFYVKEYYDEQKSEKENIDFICNALREKIINLGKMTEVQ